LKNLAVTANMPLAIPIRRVTVALLNAMHIIYTHISYRLSILIEKSVADS